MNKKILVSLIIIGVVAAIAIGGTTAYFSDTETSGTNLFKAGTVDIHVDGNNFTWEQGATLEDMKPCYTDYINLTIRNDGSAPNPVNVWKKLTDVHTDEEVMSEPECEAESGTWDGTNCTNYTSKSDIDTIINYDLYVEVYNSRNQKIWWQTIYTDDDNVTVAEIANMNDGVYLGMIPAGGYMKVTQSYHMQDTDGPQNWAQGDTMSFNVEINAVQLRGTAWLENKEGAEPWKLNLKDDIEGTLTYKVKNPTFDFTFTGKVPLASREYCLWIGGTPQAGNWDADTKVACATSKDDKTISFSGSKNLGKDVKNGKIWLIPSTDYDESGWNAYHPENYLWETGLIWYEDTDN